MKSSRRPNFSYAAVLSLTSACEEHRLELIVKWVGMKPLEKKKNNREEEARCKIRHKSLQKHKKKCPQENERMVGRLLFGKQQPRVSSGCIQRLLLLKMIFSRDTVLAIRTREVSATTRLRGWPPFSRVSLCLSVGSPPPPSPSVAFSLGDGCQKTCPLRGVDNNWTTGVT